MSKPYFFEKPSFPGEDGHTHVRSFLIRPVADDLAAVADSRIPKEGDALSDKQPDWICIGHATDRIRPDYFEVRAIHSKGGQPTEAGDQSGNQSGEEPNKPKRKR